MKTPSLIFCITSNGQIVKAKACVYKSKDSELWKILPAGTRSLLVQLVLLEEQSKGFLLVASSISFAYNKRDRLWIGAIGDKYKGDYKEGYYIGVEAPEDDPRAQKAFIGPNVWPAADTLPGWRETMERYHLKALVARAVSRLISLALNLRSNFFDQPIILGDPTGILRLLHYEGHVSDCINGIYGAGAHTDFGFITLLTTDDVLALQICKDKDAEPKVWEFVAPLKEAFIVNIGDMLER